MSRIRRAFGALTMAGTLAASGLALAEPAQAAPPVTTFAELQTAVAAGGTVVLGADLAAPDGQSLTVTPGQPTTLDLAGHDLTIDSPGLDDAGVAVASGASLTIEDTGGGGSLSARGGLRSAGIGTGLNTFAGTIVIKGGTINASGGTYAAGIGGGQGGRGGNVTISGGTVTATGNGDGAGIGGGYGGNGGTLSVTGGTVTAHGGGLAAGVGGGYGGNGATVSVTGGNLTAFSDSEGAGIGGGQNGAGGSLTIGPDGQVTARSSGGGSAVGAGGGGSGAGTISNAGSLTIPSGSFLAVPAGSTMNNTGTLTVAGTVTGNGTIDNSGQIELQDAGSVTVTVTGRSYELTFDDNGGSDAPSSIRVFASTAADSGLSLPNGPTPPDGYSFTDWYTAASGGTRVTDSTDLTGLAAPGPSTLPLYAHYSINSYAVSFDVDGGQPAPAAQSVEYGSTANRPTDPTRTGYTFVGWFVGSATTAFNFATPITGDVALTARWSINSYAVSFDVAGGAPAPAAQSVEYGSAANRPTDPTRTGYTFAGWFVGSAATAFDFATPITGDLALTARWSINSYAVTFDAAGGAPAPATQQVDYLSVAIVPDAPIRTGYTFLGWFAGSATTTFDFTTPVTGNLALTARWSINSYAVTFDAAGGTPTPAPQSVDYLSLAVQPVDPIRIGYTFAGWYAPSASTPFEFATPITGALTLTARWTINTYAVTFDAAGGDPVPVTQQVVYLTLATEPADPVRTGYTFLGWFAPSVTGAFDFTTPVVADLALVARYSINSFTISFDADNGTQPASQTVEYQATVTRPADPVRAGYTFTGWFLPSSTAPFDFTVPVTTDLALTARWTRIVLTVTELDGSPVADGSTLEPGQRVVVTVSGLRPVSAYALTVRSAPIVLARVTTDALGRLSGTVTIPKTLAAGTHRLTVDDGSGTSVAGTAFRILPAVGTVPPSAPTTSTTTSTSTPLAQTAVAVVDPFGVALVLLVAGLTLLVAGRRRSRR